MASIIPFGLGSWIFIGIYLLSLIGIGFLAKKSRKDNSLDDYYLAGRGFGPFVLVLTLYATQYSGNSVFGVAGNAYRLGFDWLIGVHYMLAIVICYLIFAGRLFDIASKNKFLTPSDFLRHRYQSSGLCLLASIIMIICLSNYFLAQLMTMGRAFQGLSGVHGDIAYYYGVVVLALIMVIYGTIGGIRAVAWTDIIQGTVLLVGLIFLIILINNELGSIEKATQLIQSQMGSSIMQRPSNDMLRQWVSYLIVIGLGGALYPQAIQRIYSAESKASLYKSLSVMSFLPYTTALIALIAGIYALAFIPGLEGSNADQALSSLLRLMQETSIIANMLVVLIFSAFLAALMSTADSAMLSIGSMFTKDIYKHHLQKDTPDEELAYVGKRVTWGLVVILVFIAILLKDHASLISLIDRKFDLLVQLSPAFILGLYVPSLKGRYVLIGLIVGVVVALFLAFVPLSFVTSGKIYGFHPGVVALPFNLLIALAGSFVSNKTNKG
jgi:SSS family solute:Na+ symporter